MWRLSQDWYRGRLDRDYRPATVAQLQNLLTAVGLDGGFWQLA
jgi:hypothetical protein